MEVLTEKKNGRLLQLSALLRFSGVFVFWTIPRSTKKKKKEFLSLKPQNKKKR